MKHVDSFVHIRADKIASLLARYGIEPAIKPFPEWKQALRAQCFATVKAAVRKAQRFVTGKNWKNRQSQILHAYDSQWTKKKPFAGYAPKPETTGAPWVWGNKKWLMSNEAGAAIRLVYLDEVIERLAPRSVLEVGCGNGLNLLLLSTRYPNIRFVGVEPTQGGVNAARSVIEDGQLPDALVRFAPFEIADPRAASRVQIEQGDASALPFKDGSFDLVITSLALEQMEEIRSQALREIVRVSGQWVAMLEPFRDVNASGWRRFYVTTHDYFQGRIMDLPGYGLEIREQIADMPHKAILGTALVIAQRVA